MNVKNKISKAVLVAGLLLTAFTVKPSTNLGLEVLFTTNLLGQVDFDLAKTINENLKSEIEKQFLKLNLTKLKSDVVHSVTLNIKTL